MMKLRNTRANAPEEKTFPVHFLYTYSPQQHQEHRPQTDIYRCGIHPMNNDHDVYAEQNTTEELGRWVIVIMN